MKYDMPTLNGPKDTQATVSFLDAWAARESNLQLEDHLESLADAAHELHELACGLKLEDGEPDQVAQQKADVFLQEIEAQVDAALEAVA